MRKEHFISENDERVLACAQLNAELTVVEIAKMTKLSLPKVRASLTRLTNSGIIKQLWYVNVYTLGFTLYSVYLSVSSTHVELRARLVEYLSNSKSVIFFTEVAGRFNYGMSVQTKTLTEFSEFMRSLGEKFGGCFLDKRTTVIFSLTDYPLVREPKIPGSVQSLRIGVPVTPCALDELDQEIVTILSLDPSLPISRIAKKLGQPATTVAYRFNQLKKNGVIVGSRFFIDFLKVGYSFVGHHLLLAGMKSHESAEFLTYLASDPSVYYVQHGVGAWDLEIGTVVRKASAMPDFPRRLSEKFGRFILRIDSFVICGFLRLDGSKCTFNS